MTTYIMLGNWTDQGVRAIADSPRRLDAARTAIEEMGGKLTSFHMTMGEFDFIRYVCMVDGGRAERELGFRPRHSLRETIRAVDEPDES